MRMGMLLLGFAIAAISVLVLQQQLHGLPAASSPAVNQTPALGTYEPDPIANPFPLTSPCWVVWDAVRAAGFGPVETRTMVAIARAESGCNPQATCRSCGGVREYSVGAFQLNLLAHPHIPEAEARDVYAAARWAYQISRQGTDFRPWTTYTSGKYGLYLA